MQRSSISSVCSCGAALQGSIAKKATLRCSACFVALQRSGAKKGNGSNVTVAFFFFFFVQRKKSQRRRRRQHSCRRLLLPLVLLRCNAAEEDNNNYRRLLLTTVAFFFLLWSSITAQLHEKGDGSCRRLLLPTMELSYSAAPRRRRR